MHIAGFQTSGQSPAHERNAVPRLRSHLTFYQSSEDRVLVVDAETTRVMNGSIFGDVIQTIDGRTPVFRIVERLAERHPLAEIIFSIRQLYALGIVDDAATSLDGTVMAFWDSCGIANELASEAMRKSIGIMSVGESGADATVAVLRAVGGLGIDVAETDRLYEYDLTVVLTDDYLRPELEQLNIEAASRAHRWILAKPAGMNIWIGPAFGPRSRSCWACLAQRLRDNGKERITAEQGKRLNLLGTGLRWQGNGASASALIAIQAVLALIPNRECELADRIRTIDGRTLQTRTHRVLHRPQCPVCGGSDTRRDTPKLSRFLESARITLQAQSKNDTLEGGHRICQPGETVARLRRLISPLTGIIPYEPECVEHAGYFASKCRQITPWRQGPMELHYDLSIGAGGKGTTAEQALAGCLAEAVERYSGTYCGDESFFHASFSDVSDVALHPSTLLGYSEEQYAKKDIATPTGPFRVPEPFDEKVGIRWTGAWSLTRQCGRLLPAAVCYYEVPADGHDFCLVDSNGCASGNVLEEAILHGLLELIERDALAIWWYNRIRRPPVGMSRLSEGVRLQVDTLASGLREMGRQMYLIDLTNDLRMPVVGALSWDMTSGGNITFGFGAHLDISIAVSRAASELVQLDVYCSEAANSRLAPRMADVRRWFNTSTTDNSAYLVPDELAVPALPPVLTASDDIKVDIENIVNWLARHEIEVLVVDLTRPDLEFAVARVIAPGLRHYHNRFGPGRLYDVPVSLGWLQKPRAESDLNPVTYFA